VADTPTLLDTGHIGLNVTDLAQSKEFYTKILQLEVLDEGAKPGKEFVFLGRAGRLFLTLWPQSHGRFGRSNPGLHHLSFEVESMVEVERAEARVRQWNTKIYYNGIVPHAEGAPSAGIFFEDPDGIRLEIYAVGEPSEKTSPPDAPVCGFF
jgi:lactoylglutathione lyase